MELKKFSLKYANNKVYDHIKEIKPHS